MGKYPCGICDKNVRSSGILCSGKCNNWLHFKCANLSLQDVKALQKDDYIGEWKCVRCRQDIDNDEDLVVETNGDTVNTRQDSFNCSSLADEINQSILQENEVLRQEIHDGKNKMSLYVLELEDKLKQSEDCLVAQKKIFEDKEKDLTIHIKSLEIKLKKEIEIKNNIIMEVDTGSKDQTTKSIEPVIKCSGCVIYEEETKKMLDSIRTLETIIKMLEMEKSDRSSKWIRENNGINTPPTVTSHDSQMKAQADRRWESVPLSKNRSQHGSKEKSPTLKASEYPPLQNRFIPLSLLSEANNTDEVEQQLEPTSLQGTRPKSASVKSYQKLPGDSGKIKIRCFSDSQGRLVAKELRQKSIHNVYSVIKPGAKLDSVMEGSRALCSDLKKEDVAVIIAGTNDVACNETINLVTSLKRRLEDLRNTNVLVFSIPYRYDLCMWSCVNEEIKIANEQLLKVCNVFDNVRTVDLSNIGARFHTRHGLHLNKLGKLYIVDRILGFVNNVNLAKNKYGQPIPMGNTEGSFLGQV